MSTRLLERGALADVAGNRRQLEKIRQKIVIDFPARTIEVAPNPAMVTAAQPAAGRSQPNGARAVLVALAAALGVNSLGVLLWKSRPPWQPLLDPLRPVHLAPSNPGQGGTAR